MDEYLKRCAAAYGDDALPVWRQLRDVLAPRSARGWRFEDGDEPLWCFGLGGASMLVANADMDAPDLFHLFIYAEDRDLTFASAAELAEALPTYELANRGLTDFQKQVLESPVELPHLPALMDAKAAHDEALALDR